jgi:putative phosphoesterase
VAILRAADLVVHAGDFVSAAFLAELEQLGAPVEGVAGNMDEPALHERLPSRRVVEVSDVRIGVVHDPGPRVGRPERLRRGFDGCDAVVYGHTHVPEMIRFDGMWLLNPGSPTERRRSPAHTMLVLEIDAGTIRPELTRV